MTELSQYLLAATTVLMVLSFALYAFAVISAWAASKKPAVQRSKVAVGASGAEIDDLDMDAEVPAIEGAHASKINVVWLASKAAQLAFVLLSASIIVRLIDTGRPPLANHYEFAVSFIWGMILFHIYFEWKYKVRTLALVVLPVIIGMLVYASTLSYTPRPLMPALQNSPLLTLHVLCAAFSYGAAVIAFGASVMYLLAPRISWSGWPSEEILDDIGYKAVIFTFPLLTIMIILGAIWAQVAWGSYWSWDPKETAALVTWLIYGGYLHARVVVGWHGRRSAWLLVLGFVAILFTYFGNLFFGGLHSYA